jgi:hypothetical protein
MFLIAALLPHVEATSRHVMVLAHSRTENVRHLLQAVAELHHQTAPFVEASSPEAGVYVVVSQSCVSPGDAAVVEMAKVIASLRPRFAMISHVLTPLLQADASFSRNTQQFGNKRNSVANLLHGLDICFTGKHEPPVPNPGFVDEEWVQPQARQEAMQQLNAAGGAPVVPHCIVLEDDIVKSRDAFAYFDFAAATMQQDGNVHWASAAAAFRPGILIGNNDLRLSDGYLEMAYGSESMHQVVEKVKGTPRGVFKTYAWMLDPAAHAEAAPVMRRIVLDTAPLVDAGSKPGQQYRSLHSDLVGCTWCFDYCYDHIFEWLLQGQWYLVPTLPRVTQVKGSGMTYAENEVLSIYNATDTHTTFHISTFRSILLRLLPHHGFSAAAGRRSGPGILDTFEGMLWYATEPTILTATILLILGAGWITRMVVLHRRGDSKKKAAIVHAGSVAVSLPETVTDAETAAARGKRD